MTTQKQTTKQASSKTTQQPEVLNVKLAYDPGNRGLKLWDGNKFTHLVAVFNKQIGVRAPRVIKDHSVHFHVTKEPTNKFANQTFMVGPQAASYGTVQRVYEGYKLDNPGLFLMALVAKQYPKATKINAQVVVNLTEGDLPEYAEQMIGNLKGNYEFTVGDQSVSLKVSKVLVVEEGLGAWSLYNATNPQPEKFYRGVINLGGATLDGILVDSDGLVLEDSAFRSQDGGTTDLANRIRNEIVNGAQADPSASGIPLDNFMAGIEDGSFVYNGAGLSFKEEYDLLFPDWFNSSIAQVQRAWRRQFSKIQTIIVTGGSANLIAYRVQGNSKFYLTPNPVRDNCIGILNYL